jgi:hypothetical protein
MPDMSMCQGTDCPLKETCYRYTAIANEFRQTYLFDVPYDKEKEKCDFYWPTKIMENGKDNS